jgi:hypothetical protein
MPGGVGFLFGAMSNTPVANVWVLPGVDKVPATEPSGRGTAAGCSGVSFI